MKIHANGCQLRIKRFSTSLQERLIFDSAGILISLHPDKKFSLSREIETTTGSETWVEESDIFRFSTQSLCLRSIVIKVPWSNKNLKDISQKKENPLHTLCLVDDNPRPFSIKPMRHKNLNIETKKLYLFSDEFDENCNQYYLSKAFSILTRDEKIVGYCLENPLDFVSEGFSCEFESPPPTQNDYKVFSRVLSLFSDENIAKSGIEFVVRELRNEKRAGRCANLSSERRVKIMEKFIDDLLEYFL